MDLWIRSQDEETIMKINRLDYDYSGNKHRLVANGFQVLLAEYRTKERVLEIINEIAKMSKKDYIVKPKCLVKFRELDREYSRLKNQYDGEFIMESPGFEIEPINNNFICYQLPKK